MAFRTRHWAIIGITAIGITAIVFKADMSSIIPIIGALGAAFTWDKIKGTT